MKKRILTILLVLTASAGVMVGCSQRPMQDANASETSIQQSEVIEEDNVETEGTNPEKIEQEVSEVPLSHWLSAPWRCHRTSRQRQIR